MPHYHIAELSGDGYENAVDGTMAGGGSASMHGGHYFSLSGKPTPDGRKKHSHPLESRGYKDGTEPKTSKADLQAARAELKKALARAPGTAPKAKRRVQPVPVGKKKRRVALQPAGPPQPGTVPFGQRAASHGDAVMQYLTGPEFEARARELDAANETGTRIGRETFKGVAF